MVYLELVGALMNAFKISIGPALAGILLLGCTSNLPLKECGDAPPKERMRQSRITCHQLFIGTGGDGGPRKGKSITTSANLFLAYHAGHITDFLQLGYGEISVTGRIRMRSKGPREGLNFIIEDHPGSHVKFKPWFDNQKEKDGIVIGAQHFHQPHERIILIALYDRSGLIPDKLRIKEVGFADQGRTLKVFISGSTRRKLVDPELDGPHGFLHLTKIILNENQQDSWTGNVEVYTNEKRGYPKIPLQVWLAGKPQAELEPVQ